MPENKGQEKKDTPSSCPCPEASGAEVTLHSNIVECGRVEYVSSYIGVGRNVMCGEDTI